MRFVTGTTRIVIFTRKHAFKFPYVFRWNSFLKGLLGNMDEKLWSGYSDKLSPVTFYVPGGWLSVMKRTEPLKPVDYDKERFEKEFAGLPLDNKIENFGWLEGKIVLHDYANDRETPWVTPYKDDTELRKKIYGE